MSHNPAKSQRLLDLAKATIPSGKGLVGTDDPQIPDDGEGPAREWNTSEFEMAKATVSNAEFADFVAATEYVTDAERLGWSFVFHSDVPEAIEQTQAVVGASWWRKVEGANWRDINGPDTQDTFHWPDHPVVQVSWNDAKAYADWVGGRLPSEREWEHAARGAQGDVRFPWGDLEPTDTEVLPCNIWQGQFPEVNTAADGWDRTAPAESFEPNAYGLFNMVGNVWEWTTDPYRVKSLKRQAKRKMQAMRGFKVLKGGSFLCHRSYCYRYRIAARIGNSPTSTTSHQGFRVVWDV